MTRIRLDTKRTDDRRIKARLVRELPPGWRDIRDHGQPGRQNREMAAIGAICYFEPERWVILPAKVRQCFEIQE